MVPILQSTGHTCALQRLVSAVCGHALPPAAGWRAARERRCEPTAHDFVHAVHVPHGANWQSCGHACRLHVRPSFLCGHARPPRCGAVSERLRDCEPTPHDLVHVVHAPQEATTQLRGQACLLHWRVSAECGQASPPLRGWISVRSRDWNPVPHDLVHEVQAFQDFTMQSLAHACELHGRVSARYGHT